ncbi:MAG: succinate dehydrogenase cytochrome b subunit [Oligoflexia bacterium]|nr:succinate dehydrogenase cytochrome b subunit [Oligoflexia bacterium]
MIPLRKALTSSVGKKFLMALTGLSLVLFLITHLMGNAILYTKNPELFNSYSKKLHEALGPLLYVAEVGLLAVIIIHIITALTLKKQNSEARPINYAETKTKGGPTRANAASKNMIITGIALLGFLVLHIWQMKFGSGKPEAVEANLYNVVYAVFKSPIFVGIYMFIMILLGMHLRHGFWSAFQSLGAINPRFDKPITLAGYLLAAILAFGFLGIPIWLFLDTPGGLQ